MNFQKKQWFSNVFQLQGSVIPVILPRVLFFTLFGLLISWFYKQQYFNSFPTGGIIPSIVLGLLLVFRTNTAYERYWEGRKTWGTIVNNSRNLSRQIWVSIAEKNALDHAEKKEILRLLIAFAVAVKLYLRQEMHNGELSQFVTAEQYQLLQTVKNPPLEITFWLADYLNVKYDQKCIDSYQLTAMIQLINGLIDALGGCERILRTPIPLAYAIHLKQLLLLYCLLLPFELIKSFGWGTGFVMGLISFTLFGIEAIGVEIENPFGHDANDLPLDQICDTLQRNIEDLIALAPDDHRRVEWSELEERSPDIL